MKTYKGTFNWHGEIHVLCTKSISKNAAYHTFTRVLSKKLSCTIYTVRRHFSGEKDNYQILEVINER